MSGLEVAAWVSAGAAGLALVWSITKYALQRHVTVRVTGRPEHRDQDGIRIRVENRSQARSIEVKDIQVLHWHALLRRRIPAAAGPFMEPRTPWTVEPDTDKIGWVSLRAVDGSSGGPGAARWTFSRPIKIRLLLAGSRSATSRRCTVTRSS